MVLVGEVKEAVRHAPVLVGMVLGELRPEPQALADRHAIVLVAVHDEQRRADVAHEAVR
ncbi:hypothetical protein D3C72_1921460 [compost metagenome]